MIKVANIKAKETYHIYIGRSGRGTRGSVLANPFKVNAPGGRVAAVNMYREWLWGKITERDPDVLQALIEILEHHRVHGETILGCFCHPQKCHGHVIVRALESSKVQKILALWWSDLIIREHQKKNPEKYLQHPLY